MSGDLRSALEYGDLTALYRAVDDLRRLMEVQFKALHERLDALERLSDDTEDLKIRVMSLEQFSSLQAREVQELRHKDAERVHVKPGQLVALATLLVAAISCAFYGISLLAAG